MDREEILLKEYEVCQNEIRAQANVYWLIFSIFFGASAIILGSLFNGLLSKSIVPTGNLSHLILTISIAMILVLIFLFLWLLRTNYIMGIHRRRMIEIERLLNMRAKRVENALNNPNDTEDDANHIYVEHYRPTHWYERTIIRGHWLALSLFCILIISWLGLILSIYFIFDP